MHWKKNNGLKKAKNTEILNLVESNCQKMLKKLTIISKIRENQSCQKSQIQFANITSKFVKKNVKIVKIDSKKREKTRKN